VNLQNSHPHPFFSVGADKYLAALDGTKSGPCLVAPMEKKEAKIYWYYFYIFIENMSGEDSDW
jgi:hypothetical protein